MRVFLILSQSIITIYRYEKILAFDSFLSISTFRLHIHTKCVILIFDEISAKIRL